MNKETKKRLLKDHVLAPLNENLPPDRRTEIAIELSELVTKVVTHVICHTIVYHEELLKDERMSIAHAFLQRVTTTHMCNHKLTAEGLVYEYEGQTFQLHEEYKTMTLTRAVYEHLAMFYFLFEHPNTAEESDLVWKFWIINSKKNLLERNTKGEPYTTEKQQKLLEEIEVLRNEMLSSSLGNSCRVKLADWTKASSHPYTGSIEFFNENGKHDVRKIPYSQAWKYLYDNEDMALIYRHLSMHCHPVFSGLVQYQNQSESDQGDDGIPLYLSSSFLAYLCRLFLKKTPIENNIIKKNFGEESQFVFSVLSRLSEK